MASTLRHLRSSTANKRPTASGLADGQIAMNTASGSPGIFIKDSASNVVKIGPAHVGAAAPNASPIGSSGNSVGELWVDTSSSLAGLRYFSGASFVNLTPSGTTSAPGLLELATNAETQAGTDPDRAVSPAALQSKLSDSTSTTSSTTIASSTAVKSAYDLANTALPRSGGTITGELLIGPSGSLAFEGSSDDSFETVLAVVNPTADRTVTIPDITGTLITTGDTGSVTSTMIADGTIVNEDISNSAAIADSKLATISTANKVSVSALDIDGATDIGAALADADLFVVDDGGAGTNRKTAASRITDYTFNKVSGDITITSSGVASIAAGSIVNADISNSAAIADSKLATISTADKVSLSAIDINGGTDIGAALADADLFIVDDGGAGTNRKAAASRITDYAFGKVSGDIAITSAGVASIGAGVIVNADVNNSAAIAGTKISPDFGSQTITTTGIVSAASGTAAAPSITFTGDVNTGIYSPAADTYAISTGGSERMRVTSTGLVAIGTSSTSATLGSVRLATPLTGSTNVRGLTVVGTAQTDVTGYCHMIQVAPSTAASSSIGTMTSFLADNATVGSGSSVANSYGFVATDGNAVGTNAYGFWSSIDAGTGKWGFYGQGTADNFLGGKLTIGGAGNTNTAPTTTSPAKLLVSSATYTDSSTAASGTVSHATLASLGRGTLAASNASVTYTNASTLYVAGSPISGTNVTIPNAYAVYVASGDSAFSGGVTSIHPTAGFGYGTGAGGTVTQTGARTSGVTINKACGAITLVSAAGSTTWQSFTVTNSAVAVTDVVVVNQKSGTNLYMTHVTSVASGSFRISFATTGGTSTDAPVFTFAVIKAATA